MKLFGNGNSGGAHTGTHASRSADENYRADVPAPAAPEKKKKNPRRWIYIIGAVVLVLLVLLIAYAIWERPPEIAAPTTTPSVDKSPATSAAVTPKASVDTEIADTPDVDVPEEEIIDATAPEIVFSSEHLDGVYTMLVVGRDHASNSTDSILLGRFDTVNHTIDVINIPRDTLINIGWSSTPKKINAVFPGYINSGRSGIDGLRDHIKNLLGFDVDCYAVVTLQAVEKSVNAIGGVYFDVPMDMDYDDGDQYFHVHLKKGYQLLNGYETLGVYRFRHGYANGDLGRIQVQQDLLKAIASQMISLGNIPNLGQVIDILVENVQTDLTAANIAWFARQFLQCSMEDIQFHTLPASATCLIGGISYVSIDVNSWIDMVNAYMNPYQDPVTVSNVNILTSNASGSILNSTTGEIAGGYDSFYCLTCTVKNDGKVVHHAPGPCPDPNAPAEASPEVTAPEEKTPEETPTEPSEPTEPTEPAEESPAEETPEIEDIPSAEPEQTVIPDE